MYMLHGSRLRLWLQKESYIIYSASIWKTPQAETVGLAWLVLHLVGERRNLEVSSRSGDICALAQRKAHWIATNGVVSHGTGGWGTAPSELQWFYGYMCVRYSPLHAWSNKWSSEGSPHTLGIIPIPGSRG